MSPASRLAFATDGGTSRPRNCSTAAGVLAICSSRDQAAWFGKPSSAARFARRAASLAIVSRVSFASLRSVRVHDAVNSFSRVARTAISASIGCCVVFCSGISQRPSKPRPLAASAAASISSFDRPARSAAFDVTSAPALVAASNWLMNFASSEASSLLSSLSLALSASVSLAPACTNRW